MTTLLFLRHANSEGNASGICSGQIDVNLSEKGRNQAALAAAFIKKHYSVHAAYASDLRRAIQTAEFIAQAFGIQTVTPDARLREVCVGEWEGQLWVDIIAQNPAMYDDWRELQMHEWQARPRGSESYEEVLARTTAAIADIIAQNRGKCVAIATHGKALRILNEQWAKTDEMARRFRENEKQKNEYGFWSASLIAAEYTDDGEFVRLLECGRHDYLQTNDLKVAVE